MKLSLAIASLLAAGTLAAAPAHARVVTGIVTDVSPRQQRLRPPGL